MRQIVLLSALIVVHGHIALAQPTIEIALEHGSPPEEETRGQLQRLLQEHDLSPWIFTRLVRVDERSIPHSHPALTLHARHRKDDELLLSTFVHEQLHWFLAERQETTEKAIAELRLMFPTVPAGPDAGGASDEHSTYLHLLVCQLERHAMLRLLGELKTKQVMDFWAGDHYGWIYRTVVERSRDIGTILDKHKLVPPQ